MSFPPPACHRNGTEADVVAVDLQRVLSLKAVARQLRASGHDPEEIYEHRMKLERRTLRRAKWLSAAYVKHRIALAETALREVLREPPPPEPLEVLERAAVRLAGPFMSLDPASPYSALDDLED